MIQLIILSFVKVKFMNINYNILFVMFTLTISLFFMWKCVMWSLILVCSNALNLITASFDEPHIT